jgi:hypothetical protein
MSLTGQIAGRFCEMQPCTSMSKPSMPPRRPAKNDRLNAMIKNELEQAAATSQPARRFNQSVRLAAAANSHASRV